MKLVTVKKAAETGNPDIQFVYVDKTITEVIVGKLHIRKGESYNPGLQVLIEAPFESVTRWETTGTIEGFPPAVSLHETQHEAERAAEKLQEAGANTDIRVVTVQIDDADNVVAVAPSDGSDDLPF